MIPMRGASASWTRQRSRRLDARLGELERFYEAAIAASRGPTEEEIAADARAKVLEILAERGVVQQESESMFNALARALGLSSAELRDELEHYAMSAGY